jgi:hypothetical protein
MATPVLDAFGGRPLLLRRLLVLAAAIAIGLVLQHGLRARLDAIAELSERDVVRARAELALVFRVVGTIVFGVTGALGVAIAASSRHAVTSRARLGLGLGIALLVASLAGLALIGYMAAVLLACRA